MSAQLDAIAELHPDAQRLVCGFLDAFPGSALASGKRSIDDQARIDAENEAEHPGFLLHTYADSPVKSAMTACAVRSAGADAATLGPLFASVLGGFSDDELSHFSLHLSGHAADLEPVHDHEGFLVSDFIVRTRWCRDWIARYVSSGQGDSERSKVLTNEDGLTRLHVQLFPASAA